MNVSRPWLPRVPHTTVASAALLAGLAAALVGCQESRKLTPDQKVAANKQWNGTRASVLAGLAADQFANGNFDKCQESLDQALRLQPTSPALHLLAAKLAIEQGKLELADSHLAQARAADPDGAEAYYLSGVVLQRWQQPQKACEAYAAAAAKDPGELAYLLAESEMLVALDRPADALAALSAKQAAFEHSGAIRDAIGQLLVQQRRYAEGVAALREASLLSPDDLGVREHLAFAQLKAGQFGEAADSFDRLVRDPADANRADLFAAAGRCRLAGGDLTAARADLQSATTLQPASVAYWLDLGRIEAQSGDLPAADAAARRAAALDPRSAEASCLLGYVRMRQGQLAASLAAFRRASELDPTDTVSLCLQGCLLSRMGHAEEAAPLYARALKLNPNDPLAHRLAGTAANGGDRSPG